MVRLAALGVLPLDSSSHVDTIGGHVAVTDQAAPELDLSYFLLPHQRFDPYLGAGINASFFYDVNANAPLVQKFSLSSAAGGAVEVGFDYDVAGPWFVNFDFKQIFVTTDARVHALGLLVKANDALNPSAISAGIAYRF